MKSNDLTVIPDAVKLGLTRQEGWIFDLLRRREMVGRDAMMSALYDHRSGDNQPAPKIIDVFICHMRKKLKPWSIDIETIHGRGYRLAPGAKARIDELCVGGSST